jgi:glycosyltransferase involved in cell wall biosynthesis
MTHCSTRRTDVVDKPMVSIGMPVYNGERFVRKAIESILSQTYPHFELLISDNASTDATSEICREYASRDARVYYVRQERNIGAIENFRFVLDAARHERFVWAAADDWWDVDRLEKLVLALTPADSVVIGTVKRYLDNEPYAEYTPISFGKGEWWKFLMREEARCDKVYFIYGLLWKSVAQEIIALDIVKGYAGDAIFNYGLLWRGNLKSIQGATLNVLAHSESTGTSGARGFRWSLARLLYRAHPWDYYARYYKLTPSEHRLKLALALVIKAFASQIHLWWRAFRRVVLKKPYVHGALPGAEYKVYHAGL